MGLELGREDFFSVNILGGSCRDPKTLKQSDPKKNRMRVCSPPNEVLKFS